MYNAWKKASFSLMAIAALVFLFAPLASAQERVPAKETAVWGIPAKDIVGMNIKAKDGQMVGTVEDMTLTGAGKVKDVIVGLAGTDREVAVPMRDFRFTDQNFVMYKGTKASLDKMTTVAYIGPGEAPARGYWEGGFYTEEPGNAFFRPESHFYPYQMGPPEHVYPPARGYYSEQPESTYQNHGNAYWDTRLPRTPYFSYKRWLP